MMLMTGRKDCRREGRKVKEKESKGKKMGGGGWEGGRRERGKREGELGRRKGRKGE